MIFYRFTLLIVDYVKKTDERCNYAYIYYSRTHIRRMHGAFYVFLLSEIQRRHNLHKTKKKTAFLCFFRGEPTAAGPDPAG